MHAGYGPLGLAEHRVGIEQVQGLAVQLVQQIHGQQRAILKQAVH